MFKDNSFLEAFQGKNKKIPVWFMRQAGRYLPEYRQIREKHSLEEMFGTPEIAAEITCLPIDLLGVDAAILFADILTLPSAMGCDIVFDNQKGPIIDTKDLLKRIGDFERIDHIVASVRIANEMLAGRVPLIGFAGSPFTVLTYLIEGGSSVHYRKTMEFMMSRPDECHRLMELLTRNTIRYYQLQKDAGVHAFQLFDTWAGILRASDYAHFVLPYIQQIFKAIEIPSIYYLKNTLPLLPLMDQSGADFLSVDHTVVLGHQKIIEKTDKGIQGNLYNGLLYAGAEELKKEVRDVLIGGAKHDRFIFNLSHGIFPDVSPDQLKMIVEQVHTFELEHA